MSRTPGRTTDVPDDAPRQLDEVDRADLAEMLTELSEQLTKAANLLHNRTRLGELDNAIMRGYLPDDVEQEEFEFKSRDEFRRALVALREFRRQYTYWERVVAEYALARMEYTQRDAAKYLGVGVSTINRWAQHPLTIDEHR